MRSQVGKKERREAFRPYPIIGHMILIRSVRDAHSRSAEGGSQAGRCGGLARELDLLKLPKSSPFDRAGSS